MLKKYHSLQILIVFGIMLVTTVLCGQEEKSRFSKDIQFLAEFQIILSKSIADSSKAVLVDSLMAAKEYSWENLTEMYKKKFHKNTNETVKNIKLIEQYLTTEMKRIQKSGEKKAMSDMGKKILEEKPRDKKNPAAKDGDSK